LVSWKLEGSSGDNGGGGGGCSAIAVHDADACVAPVAAVPINDPAPSSYGGDGGGGAPAQAISSGEKARGLRLVVRSMSGEILLTLARVDGSLQRGDLVKRLTIAAPAPAGHVYKLVSGDGAVLAGGCALANLALHSPDDGSSEAEAPLVELVAVLLENPAQPMLEEARGAVFEMHRHDVLELRALRKPPLLAARTVMALALLADIHVRLPSSAVEEERLYAYWGAARESLLVPGAIGALVRNLDSDQNPEKILEILGPFVADPDFHPDMVARASLACKVWCTWCHALHACCEFLVSAGVA